MGTRHLFLPRQRRSSHWVTKGHATRNSSSGCGDAGSGHGDSAWRGDREVWGERGGTQRPERRCPFCGRRPAGVARGRCAGQNCGDAFLTPVPVPAQSRLLLKDPSPARSPPPAAQPGSQSRRDGTVSAGRQGLRGAASRRTHLHSERLSGIGPGCVLQDKGGVGAQPGTPSSHRVPVLRRDRDPRRWESRGQRSPLGPGAASRAASALPGRGTTRGLPPLRPRPTPSCPPVGAVPRTCLEVSSSSSLSRSSTRCMSSCRARTVPATWASSSGGSCCSTAVGSAGLPASSSAPASCGSVGAKGGDAQTRGGEGAWHRDGAPPGAAGLSVPALLDGGFPLLGPKPALLPPDEPGCRQTGRCWREHGRSSAPRARFYRPRYKLTPKVKQPRRFAETSVGS